MDIHGVHSRKLPYEIFKASTVKLQGPWKVFQKLPDGWIFQVIFCGMKAKASPRP